MTATFQTQRSIDNAPRYLRLLSDIHVDVNPPHSVRFDCLPTDTESLLVLAGDFGTPKKLADWLQIVAEPFPYVVAVLGNHDYWGMSIERAPEKWREALAKHLPEDLLARFTLLEQDILDVGTLRIIGTTLWSDYQGADPYALRAAQEMMRDHKQIRTRGGTARFSVRDAFELHQSSLHWLDTAIGAPWSGSKLVVTHHAPSRESIYPAFRKDDLSGAYASCLDDFVARSGERGVHLWLHGHTHHAVDYHIGAVRVLSNAYGYPNEGTGVILDQAIALDGLPG
jgi:predicted phosphodiesterase